MTGWVALLVSTVAVLMLRGPYERGSGVGQAFDLSLVRATLDERIGTALAARLLLLAASGVFLSLLVGQLGQPACGRPPGGGGRRAGERRRTDRRGGGGGRAAAAGAARRRAPAARDPAGPRGGRTGAGHRPLGDLGGRRPRLGRHPGLAGTAARHAAPDRDGALARRPGRDGGRAAARDRRGGRRAVLQGRLRLGGGAHRHRGLPVLARPRQLERADRHRVRAAAAGEDRLRGRDARRRLDLPGLAGPAAGRSGGGRGGPAGRGTGAGRRRGPLRRPGPAGPAGPPAGRPGEHAAATADSPRPGPGCAARC